MNRIRYLSFVDKIRQLKEARVHFYRTTYGPICSAYG